MTDISALQQQRQADLTTSRNARRVGNQAAAESDLTKASGVAKEIQADSRTANATNAANAAAASASATASASAAATAATDQTNAQNATTQIGNTLSSLGLGGMTTWATNLAYSLAGQGIDPTDIVNTITSQMNNPLDANGQVDTGALAAFNAALPGFNALIAKTGQNGSPGSSPAQAIANYISYNAQVQQFATQAGLVPGTITAQDIGDLWANQSSSAEVSDRITQAVSNANLAMANPNIGSYLQSQGLSSSTLASFYINPDNTMQSLNSLNAGVAGAATGFGDMSQAQSQALAAFLSTPSANGVTPVTTQQAEGALTSSLGNGMTSAAGMANAGFETAGLGTSGSAANPGVVSGNQILGAVEGNQADVVAARRATETRTAGSSGGGGFAAGNQGVSGAGYGSQ